MLFSMIFLLFTILRHIYLVRFALDKYMSNNHSEEWHRMKYNPYELCRFNAPYINFTILLFIWFSRENFKDKHIDRIRKKLKFSLVWVLLAALLLLGEWCIISQAIRG